MLRAKTLLHLFCVVRGDRELALYDRTAKLAERQYIYVQEIYASGRLVDVNQLWLLINRASSKAAAAAMPPMSTVWRALLTSGEPSIRPLMPPKTASAMRVMMTETFSANAMLENAK
jgi:hypothetical protein